MRRTINVDEKTYQKFKSFGLYGETADDILNKLMFKGKKIKPEVSNKVSSKV